MVIKPPKFLARSSSVSLQRGIVKAIRKAGQDIPEQRLGIWDGTNSKPEYPFIKIGEELTSGNLVSKDATGKTHNLTLHIWSDYTSSYETKMIADYLVDLLVNSPIELADGFCISKASLDHTRYTEASNGTSKIYRAYLFLDFDVTDTLVEPR